MLTISDIRQANKAHGGKFFSAAAMRGFNSQVLPTVYGGPGGVYFVTSERYQRQPRHFTVRRFDPDTSGIWTPYIEGRQCGRLSEYDAKALAAELAEKGY